MEARKSRLLQSANTYFHSGEYDKAKIEYLNVLSEDAQNATALERLGRIWLEQGSPLQAAPFLLALKKLAPENVDARAKLAAVFLYAGQIEEARKEAVAILDQSASHEEAMRLLADASLTQEELKDAEQRLRRVSADDKPGFHLALAGLSLRTKDLASAETQVRRALSLDPNSVDARVALAKCYWLQDDRANADREFREAAQLAPPRSPARLAYAEFMWRTGDTTGARELLNEMTRHAPDSLSAWRLLAQIALAEKKFDESLTLLENALVRDPGNIDARLLQIQGWLGQGEAKKAIVSLQSLEASFPKAPIIKYQLARAYLQDNNTAQAAFLLDKTLAENPDYVEARLLLCQINLRTGNARQVVSSMLDLLKQRPGLVEAQVILAQAYQSLGQLDEAAAIFREQIKANPQSVAAYLSLGLILRQQNKLNEARETIETARQLAPKSLLAISQLVNLDLQEKNYDAALGKVRDQLQKSPDSAEAYFLEGKIYAAQAKWNDAEVALLKALERNSDFSDASNLLVSTYVAANRLSRAIDLLERKLSKEPDDPRTLMTLAMICERTTDFPRARDVYEKLVALKPDFAPALNNLAYLYAEHFDLLDRAQDIAQRARSLQPTDPRIADTLGWILYKKENYQQALSLLQESAGSLPESHEVQFHLGMASYMMGQRDSARDAFLRAAAAPADFPGKEEAERKLALLESADPKAVELSSQDLEATVKQQPNDPVVRVRLGESYEKQGDFSKAAVAYEQAIRLNPQLLAAAVKLAELHAGPLQSSDKALEFATKAKELAPNDAKVLATLGGIAHKTRDYKWAYSLLQRAARQLPTDPQVLTDLAWAAYSQGKVPEARNSMTRMLDVKSDVAQVKDAKLFLKMTAFDTEHLNLTEAEPEVDQVLEATPDYVPALLIRTRILAEQGESEAAIAVCSDILQRFPDFAPAQKQLASLYLDDPNKRDEAYSLATKARQTLPDDPEIAQILGQASYQKKEFANAIQLLQQSANQKPLDAKQLYILGKSHFNTKDKSRSREALDQTLNSGLPEELAEDARRTIKELGNE